MTYPNTGSTLDANGVNKTSTAISTNILITVGPNPVGAVQRLTIQERRAIRMIDEIGTDGHIDSVPNQSTNITGTCERIRFDRMRIAEAFGRSYLHAKSQRFPFDIVIIDNWNGNPLNPGDNSAAIITTIKNVWIGEISYGFQANDWIITDTMNWEAETIYSHLGSGKTPAAQGGERAMQLALSSPTSDIEQSADIGGRRGALDATGLLRAFLPY
jgi:hypothetical protein